MVLHFLQSQRHLYNYGHQPLLHHYKHPDCKHHHLHCYHHQPLLHH